MNRLRILSAGAILGIAGLLTLPASSAHAAPAAPTGRAQAAALQLTVNPQALLNLSPDLASLLKTLPVVGDVVKTGGTLGLTIDGADATGTLTTDLKDVTAGHADSTPVHIDLSALSNLVSALDSALKKLTGVSVTNTLLGVLNSVDPAIAQSIAKIDSDIPGALTGLLQALTGAEINTTISANFGENRDSSVLTLPTLPSPLGSFTLAPFHAHALDIARATSAAPAGAGADNTTTNLAVLPTLGALTNIDIAGLITQLTNLKATLNTVVTTVQTGLGVPVSTVQNLVSGTPLAGLTNQVLGVVQQTTNTLGQQVVNAAPLTALQSQLDALIAGLTALKAFQTGFNGLNGLVRTAGVTSTASLVPDAGGITAQATTKLADIDVLPLPVAIPNLAAAGTSLIHLEAVTADSTSSLGTSKDTVAHGGLGAVSILGRSISLDQLGLGQPMSFKDIPGLTVNITRGVPVRSVTSQTATSSNSVLEIQVLTSSLTSSPLAPLTSAFGVHSAAASSGTATQLVDLRVGTVTTEASRTALIPLTNGPTGCSGGPCLHDTGMFGPAAAAGGAGIAGVAILMQILPRIAARRRRDG